jgi:hypothetical protein
MGIVFDDEDGQFSVHVQIQSISVAFIANEFAPTERMQSSVGADSSAKKWPGRRLSGM